MSRYCRRAGVDMGNASLRGEGERVEHQSEIEFVISWVFRRQVCYMDHIANLMVDADNILFSNLSLKRVFCIRPLQPGDAPERRCRFRPKHIGRIALLLKQALFCCAWR